MSTETYNDGDTILCPACGDVAASDLWEFAEDDNEIECGSGCGATIMIMRHVSVTYTAKEAK